MVNNPLCPEQEVYGKKPVDAPCCNRNTVIKVTIRWSKNGRLYESVTTLSFEKRADP